MNKPTFLSIALAIISFSVFSQDDYVVTTKGDTLFGKLTFQQIGKIEQIQIKGKKKQNISSIQVMIARSRNKIYRPVQFSGTIQMMEVLKDGYLSLLAFRPPGIMNYDGRLLEIRGGDMLEVPTIGFKKRMNELLKNDEELAARIKDGDLDRKDLNEIIDEYNLFIDKKTQSVNEETQAERQQVRKLESVNDLMDAVKNSSLETKEEILEMLAEVKEKISTEKPVPQYLSNALREKMQSNSILIVKLESILKD